MTGLRISRYYLEPGRATHHQTNRAETAVSINWSLLRAGLVASVSSFPQLRLAVGEMDPQGRPSQFAGPERFSEETKVGHVSAFRRTVLCRDI
jgi:hypothetical protein